MKILHIVFNFFIGGSQTLLVDLANAQIDRGHDVSIVCINDQVSDFLLSKLSKKIRFFCLKKPAGSKNLIYALKLNYLVFKINPSIIHAHNENISKILFILKEKSVLTVHDTVFDKKKIGFFGKIVAISDSVENKIREDFIQKKVYIVYNGVNIAAIKKKNSNKFHGNKISSIKIVQVSRLVHQKKGQDLLIDAVVNINKKYGRTAVFLDFIGAGESEKFLKNKCNELNANSFIKFIGEVDRDVVYEKLSSYDALIQPSLYEGFGLTVVEAAAAGIDLLVSDIEGPADILSKIGFGDKFSCGNVDDLCEKIEKILLNRSNKKEVFNLDFFDIKRVADEYDKVYSS